MNLQYINKYRMSKGYPNAQPGSDIMPLNIYCDRQLLCLPGEDNQSYVCAYYNNCLYLIQCYGAEPEKQINLHVFIEKQKQWKSYPTSFQKPTSRTNNYFPKPGAASALVAENIYIFGGKEAKGKQENRLCVLNLQKKMWKVDVDSPSSNLGHISPESRADYSLFSFKQDYLILYGGLAQSMDNQKFLNIWIFDIHNCCWHRAPPLGVPNYINTSACIDNDKLYILGAKAATGSNNMLQSQSNLIQISIERSLEQYKPPLTLTMQQVFNSSEHQTKLLVNPSSRYHIVRYDSKLLMLLQMLDKQTKISAQITRLWFYDTMTHQWQQTQIQLSIHPDYVVASKSACFFMHYNKSNQAILKMIIPESETKMLKNYIRYKQWKKCQICYETLVNKNTLMEPAFKLSKQLLDSLTQKIKFPFAAFGLLAEIALSHSATYINFHYDIYKQNPILKIQDDNRSNFTHDELQQLIVNFEAEVNLNFGSVDKRVRTMMTKDFLKKEFGTNLKIAAMRLGSQLLYVSLTPNYQGRVAYFHLEDDEYVCYYYVFDEKTNKVLEDYSSQAKLFVQSKYDDLIKQALHEVINHNKFGPHKSTMYIMGLKTVLNDQGVRVSEIQPIVTGDQRDLIYISYNPSTYKTYLDYGCKINQSVDVSLSTYLSLLFLKNQNMRISVQLFKFERKAIRREESYENVDRNAWTKFVSTIDNSIKSYDLKLIDLMVNNKLNKKLGLFHNGILIYHKNRLIKRFDCELGELLNYMEFCQEISYGYFNIFGRIELPDAIEPNQQKTDFVSQIMLQKLYSRLKVIHEICRKSLRMQKQQIKVTHSKQRHKQKVDQHEVRHPPMKKIKRSNEDQSYSAD